MNLEYDDKINIDIARSMYLDSKNGHGARFNQFSKNLDYSHAYVVTNEDLRFSTSVKNANNARVLTVAASGEQPLFYLLGGAKHVDTFDITFCAKAVMDIKFAAIQQKLPYTEYKKLLSELYFNPNVSQSGTMQKLFKNMPSDSVKFIRGMNGCKIFNNGLAPESYQKNNLNNIEYDKLCDLVKSNMNFIWSDVAKIHTKLTTEYDIINLSNIFEWFPELMLPVLNNLHDNISIGGMVLIQSGHPIPFNKNVPLFLEAQKKFGSWAKVGMIHIHTTDNIAVLQRLR